MDAQKLIIRTNPAQDAYDRHQAAVAAQRARKAAESNARIRTKLGDTSDDAPARASFATSR